MKTNKDKLIIQSLVGRIHHPTLAESAYQWGGYDGKSRVQLGVGGITYNFKIGDNCMNMVGDHIEPGVSLKNSNPQENNALNTFACVGNIAKVITGDAKGSEGVVTGKHGGIDHVLLHFGSDVLEKLVPEDKILIKAWGVGLALSDFPQIKFLSLDPVLLEKMNIKIVERKLQVGVSHIIPAKLMGAGLGSLSMQAGDYDIMSNDKETCKEVGLETLRVGDIVLIEDHLSVNGAHYQKNAATVGVICHGDSYSSGHGPGVTVLFSAPDKIIEPFIDKKANLKELLDV
ncbi:MAG: DUF4438 domain-containing protein [Erysipelotrichaceae bacterium]